MKSALFKIKTIDLLLWVLVVALGVMLKELVAVNVSKEDIR